MQINFEDKPKICNCVGINGVGSVSNEVDGDYAAPIAVIDGYR